MKRLLNWRLTASLFWHIPLIWIVVFVSCHLSFGLNPLSLYFTSFTKGSSYASTLILYVAHLLLGTVRFKAAVTGNDVIRGKRWTLVLIVAQVLVGVASVFALRSLLPAQSSTINRTFTDDATTALHIGEDTLRLLYAAVFVGLLAACRYAFWDERREIPFPRIMQHRLARFRGRLYNAATTAFATSLVSLVVFHLFYFYFGGFFTSAIVTVFGWFTETPIVVEQLAGEDWLEHIHIGRAVFLTLLLWELEFHVLEILLTDPLPFSITQPSPSVASHQRSHFHSTDSSSSSATEVRGIEPPLTEEHVATLQHFHKSLPPSLPYLLNGLSYPDSSYIRHLAALDLHRIAFFDRYRRGVYVFGDSKIGPWLGLIAFFCQRTDHLVESLSALTAQHQEQRAASQHRQSTLKQLQLWFNQLVRDTLVPVFQPVPINNPSAPTSSNNGRGSHHQQQKKRVVEFPWLFARKIRSFFRERTLERELLGDWQAMVWLVEALGQLVVVSKEEDDFGIVQNTDSLAVLLNALVALHTALETFLRSAPPPMIGRDPRLQSHQFIRLRPYALIDSINRTISVLFTTFEPFLMQIRPNLTAQTWNVIDKVFRHSTIATLHATHT